MMKVLTPSLSKIALGCGSLRSYEQYGIIMSKERPATNGRPFCFREIFDPYLFFEYPGHIAVARTFQG